MAFEAGEVYALLGGKFSVGGFAEFDAAMKSSARAAGDFEKRITESQARASAATERSSQAAQKFGHVAKLAAEGGALALAGGIAASVVEAAKFERAMRNVNSIAGLSPKQFAAVKQSVLDMSRSTAQAPKVLADGLYQIYSSGIKGEGALKVLRASAVAASAGLTDTGTAATAVVGVLNAYHLSASQAAHVSDILFQTVNRGVITFPQLAQTIGTVLPFANALKIPLRDVGAAVSTLTKEGIPAANATTYLKNAMTSLTKPSKDLQAAIKDTGASSGAALVQSNGFEGALRKLIGATDGSQAAIHKLFPDIRASAAVLALTGSNAQSAAADLRAFGDASTKGAAQKVFAEQAKSASFQLQQLKANLSAAAITIGNALLPTLNNGAQALSKFFTSAQKSGDLKQVGQDVKAGFDEAVHVIGDFVHIGGEVVGTVGDIAGAFTSLFGIDFSNAGDLETFLEALVAFKGAQVVVPMLARIGGAMNDLQAAFRTAPNMGAFFKDIGVGPVGVATAAVAGLAAAFLVLGNRESEEARIADREAAAKREQAAAQAAVLGSERSAAQAGLDLKRAHLAEGDALATVNRLKREGKTDTEQGQRAELAYGQAVLDAAQASHDYGGALAKQSENAAKFEGIAAKNRDAVQKEINQYDLATKRVGGLDKAVKAGLLTQTEANTQLRVQASLQADLKNRTEAYIQAVARSNVTDLSRQRLMEASSQITNENALGIARLVANLDGVPKSTQARLLVDNQGALSKLGTFLQQINTLPKSVTTKILTQTSSAQSALAAFTAAAQGVPASRILKVTAETRSAAVQIASFKALVAGVPLSKVTKIDASSSLTAAGQVRALQAAIDSLHGKSVTNTVTNVTNNTLNQTVITKRHGGNARGRGPGAHEASLIGEGGAPEWVVDRRDGSAFKTPGPMLFDLGPDDYVIPTESRYAGRALGLLQSLAADIGVGSYKKGRKALDKKAGNKVVAKMPVPPEYTYAAVDETQFSKTEADALAAYQSRVKNVASVGKKLQAAEKALSKAQAAPKSKGKAGRVSDAQTKVNDLGRQHQVLEFGGKYHGVPYGSLQNLYVAWQEDKKDLQALHSANQEITRLNTVQGTDRLKMSNAAATGDVKAYDAAQADRQTTLGTLHEMLSKAFALAQKHPNSQTAADIAAALAQSESDLLDAASPIDTQPLTPEQQAAQAAAQAEQQSGMTAAEEAQYAQLQAGVALAALTPGLKDDQDAAGALSAFLGGDSGTGGVLGEVLADAIAGGVERGGYDQVANVAGLVKQARDNVASFTGGGSNASPDVQAQIDQANAQRDAAVRSQALSDAAIQVLGGASDIGYGLNRDTPPIALTLQSTIPYSPTQLRDAASTLATAFSMQSSQDSKRVVTAL